MDTNLAVEDMKGKADHDQEEEVTHAWGDAEARHHQRGTHVGQVVVAVHHLQEISGSSSILYFTMVIEDRIAYCHI